MGNGTAIASKQAAKVPVLGVGSDSSPRPEASSEDAFLAALTDTDFSKFQRLVSELAGIHLTPAKRALLVGRLSRRLRTLGLASFSDYYERVAEDPIEQISMIDCICTNETSFFREPSHFEFIESQLVPALQRQATAGNRPKRLRVWSAACSTGQEPYSLAMSLHWHLVDKGWDVSVLATDLSLTALQHARRGVWPIEKATPIPERYLKRYMLRGVRSQQGAMTVGEDVRGIVTFQRLNLKADFNLGPKFDLVLCRNALIYFDRDTRDQTVRRLLRHVEIGGHFILGHAESLRANDFGAAHVVPNVYRKEAG